MAQFYVSRFRITDSQGVLKTFQDGDVQSVDFDISNTLSRVQGMSLQSRATTGFVLGNLELGFRLNAFVRVNQIFKDILANWDLTEDIQVSFEATFPQTFQTLGEINFLSFSGVVPNTQALSSPAPTTEATVQYEFFAQNYTTTPPSS